MFYTVYSWIFSFQVYDFIGFNLFANCYEWQTTTKSLLYERTIWIIQAKKEVGERCFTGTDKLGVKHRVGNWAFTGRYQKQFLNILHSTKRYNSEYHTHKLGANWF